MKNPVPEFIIKQFRKKNESGSFKAAVIFIDISGFSKFSELLTSNGKKGAELVPEVLHFMFDKPVQIIYNFGGFISHYIGDAIMAIFPITDDEDIAYVRDKCLKVIIELSQYISKNRKFKTSFDEIEFRLKAGIAHGLINWGIVGNHDQDKLTYYFTGEPLKNAAKGENLVNTGEVAIYQKFLEIKPERKITLQNTKESDYKVIKGIEDFKLEEKTLKKENFYATSKELSTFIGFNEQHYQDEEFRNVITFYAEFDFEKSTFSHKNMNIFLKKIFELQEIYGASHPHILYGDKGWNLILFWGAPKSYFNLTERALDFTCSVKKALPGLNINLKGGLTFGYIYSGFNGSSLRDEFTCLGKSVNFACRLMSFANEKEILVDKKIASQKGYSFTEKGYFSFKNINLKSKIFKLNFKEYSKLKNYETIFTGREQEKGKIISFLGDSDNFSPKILYLDGHAGSGKTRLIFETLKNSINTAEKFQNFQFNCSEIVRNNLNPVIAFLKNYFSINDTHSKSEGEKRIKTKLSKIASELDFIKDKTELLTLKAYDVFLSLLYSENDSKQEIPRENLFDNLTNLLKLESYRKPAIVIIEDCHWIDSASKQFFEYLMNNLNNERISLVAISRYSADFGKFRLKVPLEKLRLKVKELKPTLLYEMAQKFIEKKICENNLNKKFDEIFSEELIAKLYDFSKGNPFLIEQFCNYIFQLKTNKTVSKQNLALPDDIKNLALAQFDKLPRRLQKVCKAASVIGSVFPVSVLKNMLKIPDLEINKLLEEGKSYKIWYPVSTYEYSFNHSLIRDTIYDLQISKTTRVSHLKAAKSYEHCYKENLTSHYLTLSYHYREADNEEKSLEFLEKAADQAKDKFNNEEAISLYEELEAHYTIWKESEIENWNVKTASSPLMQKIRDNLIRYIKIGVKKSNVLNHIGRWQEAVVKLEELNKISKKINNLKLLAETYQLLGTLYIYYEHDYSGNHFDKAEEIYEKLQDKSGLNEVYTGKGTIAYYKKNIDKAFTYYYKQLRFYRKHKDYMGIARSYLRIGNCYAETEEYRKAEKYYTKELRLSKQINYIKGILTSQNNLGLIYMNFGQSRKALELFNDQLNLAERTGDIRLQVNAKINMARVYYDLQENDKIRKLIKEAYNISLKYDLKMHFFVVEDFHLQFLIENNLTKEAIVKFRELKQHVTKCEYDFSLNKMNLYELSIKFQTVKNKKELTELLLKTEKKIRELEKEKEKDLLAEFYFLATGISYKLNNPDYQNYKQKSLTLFRKNNLKINSSYNNQRIRKLEEIYLPQKTN